MLRSPSRRRLLAAPCIAALLALAGCVMEEPTVALPPPTQQAVLPPPAPLPPSAPGQTHRVDLGGRTDVALLLPQTGQSSQLGRDMLDAAELALSELGGNDMVLTPKDTHGTAEGAAAAAQSAVADGARLIIGPRTAQEADAVAPIARAAGINVLCFSNQARVAGGGVFVLGFLPEQEARRIAEYAKSTGIDHYAVLAPANPYGQLTTAAFRNAVAQVGGTVDKIETYDPGNADPRSAVEALANGASFQAVLLPEPAAQRLKNVASVLPVYKIAQPDVRLLGIDSWDVPNIGNEPSLVGGWYAAPPPDAREGFVQRFTRTYGHAPGRLATLAYDAVAVAATLQKVPGGGFTTAALTNASGFAGADGIFRLRPDGTSERGYAVLQVEREGVTVVSPAPETFQAAGH